MIELGLQQVINGLLVGAIYAVMALGLMVILGILRLATLARKGVIRWGSLLLVVGTFAWGLVAFATGVAGFRYHAVPEGPEEAPEDALGQAQQ